MIDAIVKIDLPGQLLLQKLAMQPQDAYIQVAFVGVVGIASVNDRYEKMTEGRGGHLEIARP